MIFSGAPQGTDQYIYMSLVRAIWRSPTGLTYAYPFTLYWPAPPVLFQFPLLLISWISRLTGIPAAFEVIRVLGTALSGAGLALLARRLVPGKRWRRWFLAALVLGGGWFWVSTLARGFHTAGLASLTDIWEYHPYALGPWYYWAPFLLQNLQYPLETLYHGFVFLALAALVGRRYRTALVLGLITWASHPFTAVALSAAVLPWWGWRWIRSSGSTRRLCTIQLAGWTALVAAGFAYYGLFLKQWAVLRELSELYVNAIVAPLSALQMLLFWGPWIAGVVWSVATRAGRRRVWNHPSWSLFAFLVLSQMALVQQGWILGERAVQPPHYNRGYLLVGLVVLFWRAATTWAPRRRHLPRWVIVAVLLTVPDQGLYFLREPFHRHQAGVVSRDYAAVVDRAAALPPGLLTYSPAGARAYLSAFSDQIPFDMPSILVMPFPGERDRLLAAARDQGTDLAALGIRLAILQKDDPFVAFVRAKGWRVLEERGSLVLVGAPVLDPFPPPGFIPPPVQPPSTLPPPSAESRPSDDP